MYTKTYSATLKGIEANIIGVEIDAAKGVPGFNIVGLAGKSINESRDRVMIAIQAAGHELNPKRIVVNLSPAHIRKEGSHFDLAIAVGLMVNYGMIDCNPWFLENFCFFGELSLTAEVKPALGILPLSLEAQQHQCKFLIVPKTNQQEASLITLSESASYTEIYAIENLNQCQELIELLYCRQKLLNSTDHNDQAKLEQYQAKILKYQVPKLDSKQVLHNHHQNHDAEVMDLNEVIGQTQAKRGMEIAAAGGHHLLMIGPPGCGKSMLAKRFRSLLPQLNFDQALETTKIYSVCGLLNETFLLDSPMRAPHHSASAISLVGGGMPIRPGEVSLAHNGVLFLDELTEFPKHTLEQLRQILEDKEITLNRIHQSLRYPANFILIAACNPCPCGFLGDDSKACICTSSQIANYLGKLSGPLLDRIDIHIELNRLSQEEIASLRHSHQTRVQPAVSDSNLAVLEPIKTISLSQEIQNNVIRAQNFAKQESLGLQLDSEAEEFMDHAVFNLDLSARSHQKVLRISRTIANLAESPNIRVEHLAEAMQFRSVDWEKYGK